MGHPLDVDLAALVDGTLEAEWVERTKSHVAGCSLCRRKQGRLMFSKLADSAADGTGPFPEQEGGSP